MRWAGVAAAVIAGTVAVLYLGIIGSQGARNPQFLRAACVAAMAAGGALAAVVVLLAGFALADFAISCPARGVESGSGTAFLGGSYEYSCNNGNLTISR